MAKKLTMAAVNKEAAKLNEKFTKIITDRSGNEYEVIINKYFKRADVSPLLADFVGITEQLTKQEIKIEEVGDNIYLFYILLLKYMTNISLPKNNGLELIVYAKQLLEIDVLDKIIDSLPKEEIEKASMWINNALKAMPELLPKMIGTFEKPVEAPKVD